MTLSKASHFSDSDLMTSVLQMMRMADTPAELRQLLQEQELADDELLAFKDEDLQILLSKGLRTRAMLKLADLATLKERPALPAVLITALLRKFNPDGLTGPGGWLRAALAGCAGAV